MQQIISLIFLLFFSIYNSNSTIHINSSDQLQQVLTAFTKSFDKELSMKLNSSVEYKLSGVMFNLFVNKRIAIESSERYVMVSIMCVSNEKNQTTGLAFVNSTVTLVQLQFKSCGANLSTLPKAIINMFNSTPSLPTNIVALFFVRCEVNLQNIKLYSSHGFAIFAYNLFSSLFKLLTVQNSLQSTKTVNKKTGGGMLVYFSDLQSSQSTVILLRNVTFQNNVNIFAHGVKYNCIFDKYNSILLHNKVYYAAGLTIKYTQTVYIAEVIIDGARFSHNIGEYAGAILVINHKGVASTTNIQNSWFEENGIRNACYGAALSYSYFGQQNQIQNSSYPLTIENSHFLGVLPKTTSFSPLLNLKHIQALNAIYIGIFPSNIPLYFSFKKLYFTEHFTPTVEGTCLKIIMFQHTGIKPNTVNVLMADVHAINNTKYYNQKIPKSLFYLENIENVTITGTGLFENNLGSVIHVKESNLHLHGNMIFKNNTAENGGAIKLDGNVQLFFMDGLNASFTNNQAYYAGGAIYAVSTSNTKCGIQLNNNQAIEVDFSKNTGKTAGNSIFVAPMYECKISSLYYYKNKLLRKYEKYFKLPKSYEANGLLPISTTPSKLHVQMYKQQTGQHRAVHNRTIQKFAGENSHFMYYPKTKAIDMFFLMWVWKFFRLEIVAKIQKYGNCNRVETEF